jgi:hypothetical protein
MDRCYQNAGGGFSTATCAGRENELVIPHVDAIAELLLKRLLQSDDIQFGLSNLLLNLSQPQLFLGNLYLDLVVL